MTAEMLADRMPSFSTVALARCSNATAAYKSDATSLATTSVDIVGLVAEDVPPVLLVASVVVAAAASFVVTLVLWCLSFFDGRSGDLGLDLFRRRWPHLPPLLLLLDFLWSLLLLLLLLRLWQYFFRPLASDMTDPTLAVRGMPSPFFVLLRLLLLEEIGLIRRTPMTSVFNLDQSTLVVS